MTNLGMNWWKWFDELHLSFLYIQRSNSRDWLRKTDMNWSTTKCHTVKQTEYSIKIILFNLLNQPDGHQTEFLEMNLFSITWLIYTISVQFLLLECIVYTWLPLSQTFLDQKSILSSIQPASRLRAAFLLKITEVYSLYLDKAFCSLNPEIRLLTDGSIQTLTTRLE